MKKVTITINGASRQFVVGPDKVLIDLLREDLRLTGTKQSCDRNGQCGACTVIVNGKAVRSCLTRVDELDRAEVISVEGLGTPENPHLIQEAYVLSGAIQCGYCTPGLIMATKALLDQNPNPRPREIKKALARNLCRCTGYRKIIQAVGLAGRFLRGEITPAQIRPSAGSGMVGVSHPRPSAMIKACGQAEFTADIRIDGAAEIAVVRSSEHHAVIAAIDSATGQGPNFESQVHDIQMAEVEVNTDTGEVRVIRMVTAVDAGPVIHPQNLEGQLEGGMDQGVGYALREEYIHGKTKDWVTFKFPTMKSSFDMEIIIRETPRTRGTLGATGVGEMTMVPTAPAVINAIKDACGVRIFHLPAALEKIKAALSARR